MFGFIIGTLSLIGFIKVLRWGRNGNGRFGGPRNWMLRRLFQQLDTTPGQEKVIANAVENAQRVMWQTRSQFFNSRSSFAGAMRGENFDSTAVSAAFDAQQASLDEVKKALKEGLQAVHEALNPEQRARLADLVEFGPGRFGGGWGHGRGHHGFRHANGGPDGSTVSL